MGWLSSGGFARSVEVLTRHPVPVKHLLHRRDQTIASHLSHRLAQPTSDQGPAPSSAEPADGTGHQGEQEPEEQATGKQQEGVGQRPDARGVDA